nr:probable E3 ubiquitin-protein ligase RNF217 [Tanacetum cinerariifolium]
NERDPNDIMLMDLAKNKKWRRCPSCKFYVERTDGCLHISCRCGYHFCYGCGEKHTSEHTCAQTIA